MTLGCSLLRRTLALATLSTLACSGKDGPADPPADEGQTLDGWTMVWQDEFDGAALDANKWSLQLGDGCDIGVCDWGNNELQWYDGANANVGGGSLTITAREEARNGKNYTSARLRTIDKGDWTYGRIDVRARLPAGRGLWPAIWMLSSDEPYGR